MLPQEGTRGADSQGSRTTTCSRVRRARKIKVGCRQISRSARQSSSLAARAARPATVARPNRIEFQTTLRAEQWNKKFKKMEAYCTSKDHCIVPQVYKKDPLLKRWVQRQRVKLNNGKLKADQVACLKRIGLQADRHAENETFGFG